jgi:small neutral amino acid transporter SnatA (MarC family)
LPHNSITYAGTFLSNYLLGLCAVANNIPAITIYLILIAGLSRKEQLGIFGQITIALGVQFILTGISGAFPGQYRQ